MLKPRLTDAELAALVEVTGATLEANRPRAYASWFQCLGIEERGEA